MGTQRTARYKQQWLIKEINDMGILGLGYDEDRLIAKFCIAHSSTRHKAKELIELNIASENIVRKDKSLYSLKYCNEDGSIRNDVFAQEVTEEPIEDEIADILNT